MIILCENKRDESAACILLFLAYKYRNKSLYVIRVCMYVYECQRACACSARSIFATSLNAPVARRQLFEIINIFRLIEVIVFVGAIFGKARWCSVLFIALVRSTSVFIVLLCRRRVTECPFSYADVIYPYFP